MKVTIVEGTPDEIAKAFPHLSIANPGPLTVAQADTKPIQDANATGEEVKYVGTELTRLILRRRPLSKEQLLVLKMIYNAHPNTVLATDLAKRVAYTRPEFSGLMGAFGRRVSHTDGYGEVDGAGFFLQDWDHDAGCYRYGLPETVREAMRIEKLV